MEHTLNTIGTRNIREIVAEWHPRYNERWRRWICEAYARYTSPDTASLLDGISDFATIFGDSSAPELCVLVSLYGLSLEPTDKKRAALEAHIRIVTVQLGLERYVVDVPPGIGVPSTDYGDRTKWLLDRSSWIAYRDRILADFHADRRAASDFAVRLACIRAGVFADAREPSFESISAYTDWPPTHYEHKAEQSAAPNSRS